MWDVFRVACDSHRVARRRSLISQNVILIAIRRLPIRFDYKDGVFVINFDYKDCVFVIKMGRFLIWRIRDSTT